MGPGSAAILLAAEDKLEKILEMVHDTGESLEALTDKLAIDLGILMDDHLKLADKVKRLQEVMSELSGDHLSDLQQDSAELESSSGNEQSRSKLTPDQQMNSVLDDAAD
ncbi:hypothetical protein NDU88_005769 [Pleurodeles waltl]|uniref:Uncharacterized protein n=1 Tax=Pleurodeles waltl TaxID=8319 RepID=A0AAV7WZ74_PLEWA|nr:hypothetical protein NDU88_005769 [Pleurodeles waltl]